MKWPYEGLMTLSGILLVYIVLTGALSYSKGECGKVLLEGGV